MNPLKLIIKSLLHYRKRNLLLALGFAISTAVLTGALIVGDSVKYSLNRIVEQRLGSITMIMKSGDRFFTEELSNKIRSDLSKPVSGVLVVDGLAVADGGNLRINDVNVLGCDPYFDEFAGLDNFYSDLNDDTVIISSNLAERLNLLAGDEFLLRMTKASLVPLNAPFVSDEENIVSLRVTVAAIASADKLGTFNVQNSQTAPFNVFISAARLRDLMELGNRSNMLLLSDKDLEPAELKEIVRQNWSLEDAGLKLRYDEKLNLFDIKSDRVFIDDALAAGLKEADLHGAPNLTYFINSISTRERSTPYSFISTLPAEQIGEGDIVINKWLADDLKLKPGDQLSISYFVVGPLRELDVAVDSFTVTKILPLKTPFADRHLMPDIPGMSDAGNCRDWETGVPITLDEIRDKDEDYWTVYKGTPKAFISLPMAEQLWKNRFGTYTSFRIPAEEADLERLSHSIMSALDPVSLGFEVEAVLNQASYAAENGVDFSELFGGLSFFLLSGAIILSVLLFRLNLEERKEQIETLSAMGIPFRKIRRIIANESIMVARIGGLLGMGLAIVYNRFIFHALNSIWMDIVRTSMLEVNIKILTLLIGFVISIVIAWLVIFFTLNKFLKKTVSRHIKSKKEIRTNAWIVPLRIIGYISGLSAVVLIVLQFLRSEVVNASVFFAAGGLLLLSGILLSYGFLLRLRLKEAPMVRLNTLSLKNVVTNIPRSMSIVILLAIGTFIVISTGSNKKDLFVNAEEFTSGTGGFLYYAESTIPVLNNLNDSDVKYEYGISEGYDFLQMRIAQGDDASCLNLNRITNPRILGLDYTKLKGRFSFVTSIPELDETDPWSTLSTKLTGDLIPAIADETVIKWGLGMKVGDTLLYQDALGNELKLLLVGGLAPSIFQGNVLISEENFLKHFPASSGTEAFLVDGALEDTAMIQSDLRMGMRDFGWSMEYSAQRLSEFNSITNTYLSIFLILGALGLLLGTVGLSIVLFRSIIERGQELALLRAIGFALKTVKSMLIREYIVLLLAGTLIGAISSIIATLPSFINKNSDASLEMVIAIIAILLVNGIAWISWMTSIALKNKSLSVALRNE